MNDPSLVGLFSTIKSDNNTTTDTALCLLMLPFHIFCINRGRGVVMMTIMHCIIVQLGVVNKRCLRGSNLGCMEYMLVI